MVPELIALEMYSEFRIPQTPDRTGNVFGNLYSANHRLCSKAIIEVWLFLLLLPETDIPQFDNQATG
jgi:hypothetical protein